MGLKAVIYRPCKRVGFGHALYAMSCYAAMAKALGVPFISTFDGQFFNQQGGEQGFINAFFEDNSQHTANTTMDYGRIVSSLKWARLLRRKILLIGRAKFPTRATDEFDVLKKATFLEYKEEREKVTPEYLRKFDIVYIDSVLPDELWFDWFGDVTSPVRFSQFFQIRVKAELGLQDNASQYIGLHARHGNGEHLDGRITGQDDHFQSVLEKLAHTACEKQKELGASDVICLSDNVETAKRLAELTGGRPAGVDHLPDQTFKKFLGSDPELAADRVHKMMFDVAVLAGSQHIVGGNSLFPRAARLLGDDPGLSLTHFRSA